MEGHGVVAGEFGDDAKGEVYPRRHDGLCAGDGVLGSRGHHRSKRTTRQRDRTHSGVGSGVMNHKRSLGAKGDGKDGLVLVNGGLSVKVCTSSGGTIVIPVDDHNIERDASFRSESIKQCDHTGSTSRDREGVEGVIGKGE